jgi:predicted DNA-binding transcriptional regulator YafY
MEDQPDGSLLVRFSASGQLEMAWYLYIWGDKVEVIEAKVLQTFVERIKRTDFAAMP